MVAGDSRFIFLISETVKKFPLPKFRFSTD